MKRARPDDPPGLATAIHTPLLCPTCGEHFRAPPSVCVPHRLPCSHNVCLACLDVLALSDEHNCPICAQPAEPHVANLAFAGYAEDVLQAALSCEAAPAVYCFDCERDGDSVSATSMCAPCGGRAVCGAHATVHSLKGHSVQAKTTASAACNTCPVHPACALDFMCLSSSRLVCWRCLQGLNGDVKALADPGLAAVLQQRLSDSVVKCVSAAAQLSSSADVLRHGSEAMHTAMTDSCTRFSEGVDALHAALDRCRARHIGEAKAECVRRVKAHSVKIDELEVSVGQLTAVVGMGQAALAGGNTFQLGSALQCASNMEQLSSLREPCCVAPDVNIDFDITGVEDAISSMCCLRTDDCTPFEAPVATALVAKLDAITSDVIEALRRGLVPRKPNPSAVRINAEWTVGMMQLAMALKPDAKFGATLCECLAGLCAEYAASMEPDSYLTGYCPFDFAVCIGPRVIRHVFDVVWAYSGVSAVVEAGCRALRGIMQDPREDTGSASANVKHGITCICAMLGRAASGDALEHESQVLAVLRLFRTMSVPCEEEFAMEFVRQGGLPLLCAVVDLYLPSIRQWRGFFVLNVLHSALDPSSLQAIVIPCLLAGIVRHDADATLQLAVFEFVDDLCRLFEPDCVLCPPAMDAVTAAAERFPMSHRLQKLALSFLTAYFYQWGLAVSDPLFQSYVNRFRTIASALWKLRPGSVYRAALYLLQSTKTVDILEAVCPSGFFEEFAAFPSDCCVKWLALLSRVLQHPHSAEVVGTVLSPVCLTNALTALESFCSSAPQYGGDYADISAFVLQLLQSAMKHALGRTSVMAVNSRWTVLLSSMMCYLPPQQVPSVESLLELLR